MRLMPLKSSVRPSVCPSATLMYDYHIGWNTSKIISWLIILGSSLFADSNIMSLLQREYESLAEKEEVCKKLLSAYVRITLYRALNCIYQNLQWHRAKLKTASGHHPTGSALESDLSPHGSIRSAGTREYRWLMLSSWLWTDRFGGKSQRRDATADRFASWWWWWSRSSLATARLFCSLYTLAKFWLGHFRSMRWGRTMKTSWIVMTDQYLSYIWPHLGNDTHVTIHCVSYTCASATLVVLVDDLKRPWKDTSSENVEICIILTY